MDDVRIPALIDNDFLKYLMRNPQLVSGMDLFDKICRCFHLAPMVHPYVFEREMFCLPEAKALVEQGKLKVLTYSNWNTEQKKQHYQQQFCDLYRKMNGEDVVFRKCDVFTYKEADANLGEIHSLIMAIECGYHYFYSNDGGVKAIAGNYLPPLLNISVYNIIDLFRIISQHPEYGITKKEFTDLTKGDNRWKKEISKIKEEWK